MISAKAMLENSIKKSKEKVRKVYEDSNFKEYSITRIKQESDNGEVCYKFTRFKGLLNCNRHDFLEIIAEDILEFEDSDFRIIVQDYGNGYYFRPVIIFYWGDNDKEYEKLFSKEPYHSNETLYITGINQSIF